MLLRGVSIGFVVRVEMVGILRSTSPSMWREREPTYATSTVVDGPTCCCSERLKSAYDGTLKVGLPVVVNPLGPRFGGAADPAPTGLSNDVLTIVVVCTSGGSPNAFCSHIPSSVRSKKTPIPPRRTVLPSEVGVHANPKRGPKFQL